jgi:hypothetical protein
MNLWILPVGRLIFAKLIQTLHNLFDKPIWSGGAGCDTNAPDALKIAGVNLRGRFNQEALLTLLLTDRQQLDAVG